MSLVVTKYKIACDVKGCDRGIEATPEQLSSSGWGIRMLYSGIPGVVPLGHADLRRGTYIFSENVCCPSCIAQSFYKKMAKEE